MKFVPSKKFTKHFEKCPFKIREELPIRIKLFLENPKHPLLKNHKLIGRLNGFHAFSVSGDFRVIYRFLTNGVIQLLDIGTHSQVYE